jgi:plastocyanin
MKAHFLTLGMVAVLALGGATAAALADRSTPSKMTVTVTEREYRISLSVKMVPAGTVLFVVHNTGHVAHALSVSGRGLATARTPTIQPGATRTLRLTLRGGTLKLWCPIRGHAALGMKTSLTVRGPAAGPIVTSTNSTPVSGGY